MDSIKKNKRKSVICWTVAFVLATAYSVSYTHLRAHET